MAFKKVLILRKVNQVVVIKDPHKILATTSHIRGTKIKLEIISTKDIKDMKGGQRLNKTQGLDVIAALSGDTPNQLALIK
ncbi:hypothetical protein DVA76_17995, partial [Acinetobacter baumannii]